MIRVDDFSSLSEVLSILKGRECYCFGAGRQLTEICDDIPEFVDCISGILDNNPDLHYTKKNVHGRELPIYPVDYLFSQDRKHIFIVLTSSYREEILDGLRKIPFFDQVEYTDFLEVFDSTAWGCLKPPADFKKNTEQKIPKIVHYCWFSGNRMPERLQSYVDGWKRLLPDYEFIRWDESNYDVTKYRYMYDAYKHKKWSFVTDVARLDVVHENGGLYMDTDVELIRRPDELLFNDAYIGFERLATVNTGSGFGAKKGFHIIRELLEFYENTEFINSDDPGKMILCPVYETNLLRKHGLELNGNFQIVDGITVYPVMYFNAKSLYSNKLRVTEETISIHHCTWTWAGEKNKL